MTLDLSRTPIYVTGVAETKLGAVSDESAMSMVAKATLEALTEAGLQRSDIDGIFTYAMGDESSVQVGEYLGIQDTTYSDSSDLGGGSFEAYVHHAALAIAAGRCSVALIVFGSRQRSERSRSMTLSRGGHTLDDQFQAPYGLPAPIGHYAMYAARHMYQYGTTPEQLASVAVTANEWAQLNPKAWRYGRPITVRDVLESGFVCEPLHKLDCCLITDGGGAVIVAGAAHARSATRGLVRLLGAGESQRQWHLSQVRDLTTTPAQVSGREAFSMAGISPGDVDVFEPYDGFTINVIMALEDLGFCSPGEGGPFVEEGHLRPGAKLPGMTNGGGLSYNHPGAYGLMILIEAVRQLRGEATGRQVPNAEIGVVQGFGGFLSAAQTLVLARGEG